MVVVVVHLVFLSTSLSIIILLHTSYSSSSKIIIKIVRSNDGQIYCLFSFAVTFYSENDGMCIRICIYTLLEALAIFNCIVYCAFIRSLTTITNPLEMQVKMMMTTCDGRQTVAHTSIHIIDDRFKLIASFSFSLSSNLIKKDTQT